MSSTFLSLTIIVVIALLIGISIGRQTKEAPKSNKNITRKSKQNTASGPKPMSEKQRELISQMAKAGIIPDSELTALLANPSLVFARALISRYMNEFSEFKRNQKDEDRENNWLNFEKLPPMQDFPIKRRKYLFSKRELKAFQTLTELCNKKDLKVCPKVRMGDIVEVKSSDKNEWSKWFRALNQRHIDFLILDRTNHILLGIEYDDSTHDTPEARRVDNFKNGCFEKAGLPLARYRSVEEIESRFKNDIDNVFRRSNSETKTEEAGSR